MKIKNLIIALAIGSASVQVNSASSMTDVFNEINAYGNVGSPVAIQGQTQNYYSGGSAFMRIPKNTYNLASITPPSVSAGCGGIDVYLGGFSHINKDQFVGMLKNIGSNALGYGFKLAIQNLCPTCDNVMQALQNTAQAVNRMNIDSCEAAKGIVNATTAHLDLKGREQSALNMGTFKNIFSDVSDAWGKVKGDASKTKQINDQVTGADPSVKDHVPSPGNLTWKALSKHGSLSNQEKMMIMGMVGTVIFSDRPDGTSEVKPYARRITNIADFIGKPREVNVQLPVWRCTNGTGVDACTQMSEGTIASVSFYNMVDTKLELLITAMAGRSQIGNANELINFVNATDIPIYRLVAVNTRYGSGDAARIALTKYKEYLASRYALAYVELISTEINAALDHYLASTQSPVYAEELKKLKEEVTALKADINSSLSTSYQSANVSYQVAQEVGHMERTLHSNMSQSLRQSVNFAKTLRN
ncbi:conjugal transfer protein TraH (plasmid) [Acinetobacter indicus]|uniref:conjugal transfer protein TraH n=1 Tax=Acinetobacter indicus TaxID=756892 RepID=UPI001FA78198|nr:conjugal transfer protein TraH [Acinetobacter indicus]UNW11116.1 conjugal transfer protein TraH [Acinetobacter indicus]